MYGVLLSVLVPTKVSVLISKEPTMTSLRADHVNYYLGFSGSVYGTKLGSPFLSSYFFHFFLQALHYPSATFFVKKKEFFVCMP